MTRRFRRGLVVGKFAPLHKGHELLIGRACERCDEVIVISYSRPEFPGCEPGRRERWLAELFPNTRRLVVTQSLLDSTLPGTKLPRNDEDDLTHRRFTATVCRHIIGVKALDAVFTSEDYGPGFAEELSRFFRQHDPAAPTVEHVLVDRAREAVPISGSALRSDLHAHRQFLSPAVYASFVQRICFVGGESSGKSTLAAALATHFGTAFVPEYGRELWEQRQGNLTFPDLLHIAETQVAREEECARRANRFLLCDTSPLTTLFYSLELFGKADPVLQRLANRPYDLYILCAPDFGFVQDGTRRDAAFRDRQHAWYIEQLEASGHKWMLTTGTLEQRIDSLAKTMKCL